jgi:Transglycosylase SLT domain
MGRLRTALATAAVGAALTAHAAAAQSPPPKPAPPAGAPPSPTAADPAPTLSAPTIQPGDTLIAPPVKPQPQTPIQAPPGDGGAGPPITKQTPGSEGDKSNGPAANLPNGGSPGSAAPTFDVPTVPSVICGGVAAPPELMAIYQSASDRYGLGPQGPSVLAAINQIETNFGELNQVTSSAGAIGWMQFMPSTWAAYGVDANGDGVADPYDPEDAIFAAARYLRASGMPGDTAGAIFSYNHADWYVAEVLANAGCFGSIDGRAFSLVPQLPVIQCQPGKPYRKEVPVPYLNAFEQAAARYDLGERGVWALAAVGRLESNFGKGMSKAQLRRTGPLGLDPSEWKRYAVDGDADGRIRHADPDDSAATLARMIWSRGSLRAGVFTHNQAQWYVQAVLAEADQMAGRCDITYTSWPVVFPEATSSAINWNNLTLSNSLELHDLKSGRIDPRIVGLIGAITQSHQVTISALRSDHSEYTTSGNISNHYYGRAMDIAAVDGVSCTDTAPTAPCAVLGRTLTLLPAGSHPTELIYCFDLDGASGPAFAAADHCDHLHVGFDG